MDMEHSTTAPQPESGADQTGERNEPPPSLSWKLVPAALLSTSAFFLFALQEPLVGYPLLIGSLVLAVVLERDLAQDLLLIGIGVGIVSLTSVEADVSWPAFTRIGVTLALAVTVPFLIDRLVYKRQAVRFPWRSRQKKTKGQLAYLFVVPILGWAILPFYFIRSGAYLNWPQITDGSELVRFFVGVNAVGTWDELFFVATCFALLCRHFPGVAGQPVADGDLRLVPLGAGLPGLGAAAHHPVRAGAGLPVLEDTFSGLCVIVHLLFDAIVFHPHRCTGHYRDRWSY